MSMPNLISINIKYHGHEKADVNLPLFISMLVDKGKGMK
jgi:hypothetical protein